MKALLTAGGHGTRLRPITHTQSKHLIPIANRPMLFYGLQAIAEAGIREVGIIVGETEEEIRAAVADGSRWGLSVTYLRQEAPLGLAHALLTAEEFVGGDSVLMFLGDNLVREGVAGFVRSFEESRPDAQIYLAKVPEPERFGVAVLEGDRVVRLVEKPREHISDLALCGVYLFTPQIFQAASSLEPSWRGELEITDAIQYLVDHGYHVRAEPITGWWKDTGRPEDLLEANRFVLDDQVGRVDGDVDAGSHIVGEVVVEAGAVIRESVIRGPSIIGPGCRIERSTIDAYTSIDANTVVADSEIANSIVMDECHLEDVRRISDSLVGRSVRIARGAARPSSITLMVGDSSSVTLP